MSDRQSLPPLPVEALRDHGTPARVERIWERIEADLPGGPPRRRSAMWWLPAAAVVVFGAGVFVGRFFPAASEQPSAMMVAERAAGGEQRVEQAVEVVEAEREPERAPETKGEHPVLQPRTPAPQRTPVAEEAAEDGESRAAPATPVKTGPARWQELAEEAEYADAAAALEQAGGFDAVLAGASAEQCMLLYDIAKARGDRVRAISALRAVLSRHRGRPEAPLAAFALGNMLRAGGDAAGAAKAFADYRALSPKGDFAEDALVQEIELAVKNGEADGARKLVAQYDKQFPNGSRLDAGLRAKAEALPVAEEPDDAEGDEAGHSEGTRPGTKPGSDKEKAAGSAKAPASSAEPGPSPEPDRE